MANLGSKNVYTYKWDSLLYVLFVKGCYDHLLPVGGSQPPL